MKILVKLEKLLESQDDMMSMMRTLLKSDGGLGRVDLEESICEQPCATVADLNSFSESLHKRKQNACGMLIGSYFCLLKKCPYYIPIITK